MKRTYRNILMITLTIACLVIGYGFYKMNHGDWINAIFLSLGLMGLSLSVARELPKK